jgi:hypothetical protein
MGAKITHSSGMRQMEDFNHFHNFTIMGTFGNLIASSPHF